MRRKRGVLIIAVLLSTMLVAMFIGAALSLSPFSLARGDKDQDWRLARAAASSGVEYALARLQADPSWRGAGPYTSATDPDFIVSENKGNVVGILRTGTGRFSQFRIRFNWENGTPTQDPDQMADSGNPLDFDLPSLSNVDRPSDATIPALGSRPAITVPGRAIYLAVQGRAGKACAALDSTNLNPSLTGSWGLTQVTVRTIYKISNPGQAVDPAVGMSGGNFIMNMGDSIDKFVKIAGADGQPARLRSKQGLTASGGDSQNLQASGQGQFRLPTGVNPTVNGMKNMSRGSDENPADAYYTMTWADVRKADGTNTLKAGTYVWMDDGSLHYFDMSPKDYIVYATAHPADTGVEVYKQSDGEIGLGTGVNVTSSGTGSGMKGTVEVHADTAVTPGTNTTELGILPQKGAPEKPPTSTGTGTTADFKSWMTSNNALTNAGNPTQWTLSSDPHISGFYHMVALWGSNHGYGNYGGGNWNMGSISMQIGIGSNNANIPPGQWSNLQNAVNAYLSSGDSTLALTYADLLLAMPPPPAGGASPDTVPGSTSLVDPKNLKLNFKPQGSSAVLSSEDSITIGAALKGQGASIVSQKDVNLVGLGLDLASNPNGTEGVSLFAGGDILISTYDGGANKFNDVSLKGVIYANGDVLTELGHPSLHADKWGKFKLNGSVIAYGGNPATQVPGQAGSGNIDMMTREGEMNFDPSYLTNLMANLPNNLRYGCWLWVVE
ncbi:MAG: hypothetical protein U0931_31985 [Vulcanimicrobiota bacterium]